MTPESMKIAALIDPYPEHIRRRLTAALERIVEVYRASGVQQSWVGRPARPAATVLGQLPDNVVPLRRPA